MRKYLLPILLIAFWSCEETKEPEVPEVPDTIPPTEIILSQIYHYGESFHLEWTKNEDSDFSHYEVLKTSPSQEIVQTINNVDSTSFTLSNIQPNVEMSFQINVYDSTGNYSSSNIENSSSYGLIAATSYSGGYLYTVNTNGNNLRQHAVIYFDNQIIINGAPEFTPDGSRIVFGGHIDGNYDIWSIGINGEDIVPLTNSLSDNRFPKVSPNGGKIVYTGWADTTSGLKDIYIMDSDGSNKQNITNHSSTNRTYSFSPDGSKIVFISDRSGNNEIFSIGIDGSNLVQLTDVSELDEDDSPSYSPDGEKIIFQRKYGCGYHIMIMDSDGSNVNTLTDCPFSYPVYSPNGNEIVYIQSNIMIMLMNLDSEMVISLTNPHNSTDYSTYHPSFNSDGTQIVYIDRAPSGRSIHTINIDGTNDQSITSAFTNGEWWSMYPKFQPN